MSPRPPPQLPSSVAGFLDGTGLAEKTGHTILLAACEPTGWPRLALLSVGEVLASSPYVVYLALYAGSGTTQVVTDTHKALLSLVVNGTAYKIRLAADRLDAFADSEPNAYFRSEVTAVDEDHVGYARVLHGVEYELIDEQPVLARWKRQLEYLRQLGA